MMERPSIEIYIKTLSDSDHNHHKWIVELCQYVLELEAAMRDSYAKLVIQSYGEARDFCNKCEELGVCEPTK